MQPIARRYGNSRRIFQSFPVRPTGSPWALSQGRHGHTCMDSPAELSNLFGRFSG